jgi:hypothetical protein
VSAAAGGGKKKQCNGKLHAFAVTGAAAITETAAASLLDCLDSGESASALGQLLLFAGRVPSQAAREQQDDLPLRRRERTGYRRGARRAYAGHGERQAARQLARSAQMGYSMWFLHP